ncbi:MAG: hypothetical protein GTN76_02820 [Candidatus Aenigmarchaeota archaeon]|nr:hypothetical protein [Candidatus Aenigmarchaeota archaeon]
MKNEKRRKKGYKVDPEFAHKILREMIPYVIINIGLYDSFIKNYKRTFNKVSKILASKKRIISDDSIVIVHDFIEDRKSLISIIERNKSEKIKDYGIKTCLNHMYLFQAVSIFENMLNTHFQQEFELNYGFKIKKINKILYRLQAEDKLGWVLKIFSGKDYTETEKWKRIEKFVQCRNFYIHYKPQTSSRIKNFDELLQPKKIKEFLDDALHCYNYLKKSRSKKYSEFQDKIDKVRAIIDTVHKERKELEKYFTKHIFKLQKELKNLKESRR